MVFNPPQLKVVDKDEIAKWPTVKIAPQRSKEAYIDQARRAGAWFAVLFIGWLLTRLTCAYDFPPECILSNTALEVLTDLLTLAVFGFCQAWFCEILEERRFRHLYRQFYFGPIYIFTGIILSLLETTDWWEDMRHDQNYNWGSGMTVFSVVMVIFIAVILLWHFAEAWRILPGAYYISGQVPVNIVIETNLHRIYNVSRGLILAYVLLYCAFAIGDDQGWELHYVLVAFCLSLFAQFKAVPSVVFLAITTAVWVQGVGAYGVQFLANNNTTQEEELARTA